MQVQMIINFLRGLDDKGCSSLVNLANSVFELKGSAQVRARMKAQGMDEKRYFTLFVPGAIWN